MTSNQLHGKKFEDFIKACGMFPGASDAARTVTAGFDIEARFDRVLGLPTSVKASGNDVVALSDARRFFSLDEDFRMIVGRYEQVEDQKVFAHIHEFVLLRTDLNDLRGELDLGMIEVFHMGLMLDKFPKGAHQAAREWAGQQKQQLAGKPSSIILNPKIDSKSQRRLQCSVHLRDLKAVCSEAGRYTLHRAAIGDFALPVIQNSGRRTFTGS